MAIYLGLNAETGARTVFSSTQKPNEATHAPRFVACIGPFRTLRGARFMRDHGDNNPHCRCVADAEHLAGLPPPRLYTTP